MDKLSTKRAVVYLDDPLERGWEEAGDILSTFPIVGWVGNRVQVVYYGVLFLIRPDYLAGESIEFVNRTVWEAAIQRANSNTGDTYGQHKENVQAAIGRLRERELSDG